jgi:IS5 family transposase
MAIKLTGQLGFVDAVVAGAVGGNAALDRLSGLVKWYRFEKGMKHLRHKGPGQAPASAATAGERAAVDRPTKTAA